MKNALQYIPVVMSILLIQSCTAQSNQNSIPQIDDRAFAAQWYQGQAEVNTYDLQQSRYGEIHPGEAVLIFVTEDFSKSKQVKLDRPGENPDDAITVLKMNATRQFNTGVYQYNMMQSVFTPVSFDKYPRTLKVTASSQDWCGHSWMQYNLKGDQYEVTQMSYFESEGDAKFGVKGNLLEDEVWTKIRTAPHTLPTGQIKVVPGTLFSRMKHFDGKGENAIADLKEQEEEYVYSIEYPNINRKVIIHFKKSFPHEINRWEETTISGYGSDAKTLTTTATLKKRMMLDYWRHNDRADRSLREQLGL